MNIELNRIGNGLLAYSSTIYANTSEWMGRAVKSILFSLQDRRIAAVSLVAVTILSMEISEIINKLAHEYGPFKEKNGDFGLVMGFSSLIGCVYAFSKLTKLPLASYTIIGISLTTFIAYGCFNDV